MSVLNRFFDAIRILGDQHANFISWICPYLPLNGDLRRSEGSHVLGHIGRVETIFFGLLKGERGFYFTTVCLFVDVTEDDRNPEQLRKFC